MATFRGDGGSDRKGADFTIPAGKVRVMWTVQPNDVGPVPLMWEIDGVLNGAEVPYGGTNCASCDGQQTYDVGPFRAGTYHLKVLTSRPWTLTVEEQSCPDPDHGLASETATNRWLIGHSRGAAYASGILHAVGRLSRPTPVGTAAIRRRGEPTSAGK